MKKEDMDIVIVGHVDHGKSTLIGRLLADTDSLPVGKLQQVKEICRKNSKPFEFAFLLDALKDEQSQGITIDMARCFFKTEKRNYIIIDAPGHIEFLKNMITGASRAQAALLVIDSKEGVMENSKRHGYMLSLLGIKKVVVVINKLDLVNYSQSVFEKIKKEYSEFLKNIGIVPIEYIPISAFEGDNVAFKSENMPWYDGDTILQVMDKIPCESHKSQQTFRMPVQDVYKFTKNGDDRRIIVGTVETGALHKGESVVFYPSGKKSVIKTIETFPSSNRNEIYAGQAAGVTLDEQIYIKRGEIMTIDHQHAPMVSSKIKANIFWLGKHDMHKNKSYILKICTQRVNIVLEEIISIMDTSNLSTFNGDAIKCNQVAECIISCEKPIAFDIVEDLASTSRFVIIDNYEIAGGGMILQCIKGLQQDIQNRVMLRNYKWEPSEISIEHRAERYCQKPVMVIFTGEHNVGKKELAKLFEKKLLDNGRFVYYLGIGTFLYGVDSDIKIPNDNMNNRSEHIRRFAETANLMLDSGMMLLVTARSITNEDLELMTTIISADIRAIWVGDKITNNLKPDIHIVDDGKTNAETVSMLYNYLKDNGYMFKF